MNDTTELEVLKLVKTYTPHRLLSKKKQISTRALNEVSFSLHPGLYGLLGPNGAGKSTMMNIITGSLSPTKGKVLWNGQSALRMDKKFRHILGYMPQQQNLYNSFSGRQFLLYLASLKEIPPKNATSEVERVAAAVNLTFELEKRLSAYSGGMKQRLLAATAMLGSPRLLILDEPTAGLDPKERVHLRNTLSELSHEAIVIIATHVVSDVEEVASEILLLKEGNLIAKASPKQLIETYAPGKNLEAVYLSIFGEPNE